MLEVLFFWLLEWNPESRGLRFDVVSTIALDVFRTRNKGSLSLSLFHELRRLVSSKGFFWGRSCRANLSAVENGTERRDTSIKLDLALIN